MCLLCSSLQKTQTDPVLPRLVLQYYLHYIKRGKRISLSQRFRYQSQRRCIQVRRHAFCSSIGRHRGRQFNYFNFIRIIQKSVIALLVEVSQNLASYGRCKDQTDNITRSNRYAQTHSFEVRDLAMTWKISPCSLLLIEQKSL